MVMAEPNFRLFELVEGVWLEFNQNASNMARLDFYVLKGHEIDVTASDWWSQLPHQSDTFPSLP